MIRKICNGNSNKYGIDIHKIKIICDNKFRCKNVTLTIYVDVNIL